MQKIITNICFRIYPFHFTIYSSPLHFLSISYSTMAILNHLPICGENYCSSILNGHNEKIRYYQNTLAIRSGRSQKDETVVE